MNHSPQDQPAARALAADSPAVRLAGIKKSFTRGSATTWVLQSIDLVIQPGECLFLLGPSGSGKTTLMSIIGCLLTPDAGEVEVLGRPILRLSLEERASLRRRQLGFIFQRFHLIRGLTAVENVAAPLRLDRVPESEARGRAEWLLERVGLAEKANESPRRMSVGQCQRVALARALVADPQLVLADEPTASLDADSGRQAMQLLRELTIAEGRTLVVVTHDHRIIPSGDSKDRTLAMDSGRLVESLM